MEQIKILRIKVTSAKIEEIHNEMDRLIATEDHSFVLSANVHAANLARRRTWLSDFFKKADLVHCDGVGIIMAVRLQGHKIPERITWADWAWPLSQHLANRGYRLFMLGGPEGLTEKAMARLRAHVPKLNVVGTHHGYFAKAGPENHSVIGIINRTSPDVMWVGMGMPLQEKWILENYPRLNVKLIMTCGAAFEYIAGTVSRCPQWMGDMGLEWLFRFMQNPRRMSKRYLWGNPVFLVDAILERLGVIKY